MLGWADTGNVRAYADLYPVYTPPNAAREGCNVFCEKTGKRSHVTQSNFYSVFGCKVSA